MSKKDRKQVMDDFKELNQPPVKVNPAIQQRQLGNQQQQVKLSLHEAVSMFGAQIDEIKNNLIGIIMKQDSEIRRLKEELQKDKK